MQYKVYFTTADSAYTPVLQEVRITTTISSIGAPDARAKTPRVSLQQNYPNPFGRKSPSGQTWTTAALEVRGNATDMTLKLYDMLGRSVQSLWNGLVSPGRHVVRINASALSSGLYLVRLTTTDASAGRIITVLN